MAVNQPQKEEKKNRYQVKVLREKCIGAGTCVELAEKTFQLDEKNIAVIIDPHGNSDEEKLLAAQACPVGAIVVVDQETGEQIWPPE